MITDLHLPSDYLGMSVNQISMCILNIDAVGEF